MRQDETDEPEVDAGTAAEEAPSTDESDYGPPFEARSFGGELVWAHAPGYTAKILRVRAGENVIVSTRGRRDMVIMLTGGRAVLEIRDPENTDRVELMPASPVPIEVGHDYRLVALTEVELMTIYSPAT
ncbi:MAG TPA: hypothetical protein PKW35_22290 [Nannocystaceae bacterium]|nr:hypothetical protein [Nannocystaceae bacterium]